jgi:hypothetical protein
MTRHTVSTNLATLIQVEEGIDIPDTLYFDNCPIAILTPLGRQWVRDNLEHWVRAELTRHDTIQRMLLDRSS